MKIREDYLRNSQVVDPHNSNKRKVGSEVIKQYKCKYNKIESNVTFVGNVGGTPLRSNVTLIFFN